MNIAFFSESGFDGKIPRDFDNMRTEYAWYVGLDATHHNIESIQSLDNDMYDLGIVIIPKTKIDYLMVYPLIEQMKRSEELTFCDEKTKKLDLVVAASYGGRWDIVNAINEIKSSEKSKITEEDFKSYLSTAKFEDPDLCIRTGNEIRVSNFLLWQLAYSELYFPKLLWPDFDDSQFEKALEEYSNRSRRYGDKSNFQI